MGFYEDLRKKLDPEMFTSVLEALGDDFNMDLVPRTRLNTVIAQRREKDTQIDELQSQLDALQSSASSTPPVDVDALKVEWQQAHDSVITAMKVQFAGLDKLRTEGVIDPEVAFSLMDATKISLDETGKLVGLDEQVEALRTNKAYLFGTSQGREGTPSGTGRQGGSDDTFATVSSLKDFMALESNKQIEFKQAHPEKFKEFKTQI